MVGFEWWGCRLKYAIYVARNINDKLRNLRSRLSARKSDIISNMITVCLAITVAIGGFVLGYSLDWGIGWSVFFGIVVFGAFQGVVGYFIQKRVKRDMEKIQNILADGQKRLQAKMQRWQLRPPGSIQAAQKEIFEDTRVFVKAALAETEVLKRYRGWVPLIDRQMATAQFQLNWMIKEYREVDRLMPKVMLMDPTMCAMKMARMYMLNADVAEIGKVYRKGVRRVRYNGNVLLAALWSWILVKRGDADGAFKALTEALKSSDNEVLKTNHEHLMNNRVGHFSNSQLGDQWYSLFLEEPKIRMQRQRCVYR